MANPESLFAAHRDRVFRYFCRAVDAETARDLTQEVFLRAARTPASINVGDGRAWIFRVARNLALDHHRRRRLHPEPVAPVDEVGRPPDQDVAAAVNEALAALPDLDRDVFLMRELAGLGYDEIAVACDLTPDAVRSRIHRARLRLRTDLAAPIATWRMAGLRHSTQDT
jgi:RNA polymerase sigma-70 factor (ECF subfamily)